MMDIQRNAIPFQVQTMVDSELEGDEQTFWIGQPIAKRFMFRGLPIMFFGIPWTAFSVFWVYAAMGFEFPPQNDAGPIGWIFPLFGIPFILVGFGMLLSPFLYKIKAKRTAYVLTNKRAIVFDGGRNTTIYSFGLEKLTDRVRTQKMDGSGDIILGQREIQSKNGTRSENIGFMAIWNVKDVDVMIKELVETTTTPKPGLSGDEWNTGKW